jgi:undecaprenyl-diphosphatase
MVMGLVQGVTELFPISSLAQAVVLPTVLGWSNLARAQSQPESFFLAFLVGLHVATAVALLIYFWTDWRRSRPGSPDWPSSICSGSRSPSLCSQRCS